MGTMGGDGSARCARCDRPRSRYTTGDLCNACSAARAGVSVDVPLEFWLEPDIARALATWDWSTVLAGVHRRTGASQADIARQTGFAAATISRLMSGRSGGQTIETALKLLDGLGAPRAFAGLQVEGLSHITGTIRARHESSAGGEGNAPVKRREFSAAVALAGLSASLPNAKGADVIGLERPSEIAADLYALDDTYGGASLVALAKARLASLTMQLKRVTLTPAREQKAASLAAELEVCAGWFSFEAGKLAQAQGHYGQALYASHEAGNEAVRLHVLNLMAMLAVNGPNPGKAVAISEGALTTAPKADPRLRALFKMRQALGVAKTMQNEPKAVSHCREMFERYLGMAWEELDGNGQRQDEPWFAFFSERELRGLEAVGRRWLGQPATTVSILENAISGMRPRNAAFYTLDQACALMAIGELDVGLDAFHRILPTLVELSSVRVLRVVAEFAETLTPYAARSEDAAETRRIAIQLTRPLGRTT